MPKAQPAAGGGMSLAEQLAKRAQELKPVGEAPPKQKTMAEMLQEKAG